MCGRFQLDPDPEITDIMRRLAARLGEAPLRFGEIRPTDAAPMLTAAAGRVRPALGCFGYPRPGGGLWINARAETAGRRSAFRADFTARRCAIPASAFYEWSADHRKYRFRTPCGILYLGGIWRPEAGGARFCVLTRPAEPPAAAVHDRMPVLVAPDALRPWLTNPDAAARLLGRANAVALAPPATAQTNFFSLLD